jgi:hypothetical protein
MSIEIISFFLRLPARLAIEIVPLPQPKRKAFLRGISLESVNQILSKSTIKDRVKSKNSLGKTAFLDPPRSDCDLPSTKDSSNDRSFQKEDLPKLSIKDHRRIKLQEIAQRKSSANINGEGKKQTRSDFINYSFFHCSRVLNTSLYRVLNFFESRPFTAKIKVSEPKLSKFNEVIVAPAPKESLARRQTTNRLCENPDTSR